VRALAIAVGLGAGCHAAIDIDLGVDAPPGQDGSTVDSGTGTGIDATPDAAPCTGGNANATDGTTCYEAFLSLPLSWADAEAVCETRGGRLARIDSSTENQLIATLAGANRAWIGGTDLAVEGSFVWADGAPLAYTNWRTGEPNNGNGNFEEDCALIEGQNGGTWDDRPCDTDPAAGVPGQYFYVCER